MLYNTAQYGGTKPTVILYRYYRKLTDCNREGYGYPIISDAFGCQQFAKGTEC